MIITENDLSAVSRSLKDYKGDDEVVSIHDYLLKFEDKKIPRYFSGIGDLDTFTQGMSPGEVIVVSGMTKAGKTSLAMTLTRNMYASEKNVKTLWFAYETSPRELTERAGNNCVEFYVPQRLLGKDIVWIWERIIESKLKYGTLFIVIDHLHFLFDMERTKHPSLEIGALMRKLKRIASESEVIILLICHTTKLKFDKEPDENDLRDSSLISQEADTTWLIYRKPNDGTTVLKVCNHRRTGAFQKKTYLTMVNGYFEPLIAQEK